MSFSKASAPFLIVGLVLGIAGGYFISFTTNQPRIDNYERQIDTLTSHISTLDSSLSVAQTTISTLETQVENLQSDLSEAESQISAYESQVADYQTQVGNLQSRLDDILSITVTQHYEWDYEFSTWFWDLPVPMSLYVEYWERPRPSLWNDWIYMAKDPDDDYYIDQMVQEINEAAIEKRFSEIEKVNFVIAFVQSLPYTEDDVTTPWNEYPRYPIESLFDRGGDCEDTSILAAALLDRLGYDVALLVLFNEDHAAVGISIDTYGVYYEHGGEKYFYLETTGDGWKIGQMPDFGDTTAYVYPLNP